MAVQIVENYAEGKWVRAEGREPIHSAITGEVIAETGSAGLDFAAMVAFARKQSGTALRKMTFHDRANLVKALGTAVMARKEELYRLSFNTGATRALSPYLRKSPPWIRLLPAPTMRRSSPAPPNS